MFFHFIFIFLLLISNSTQNIFKYNLFHQSHPSEPKKPPNPIVIIPGDAGSRLRANLTGKPSTVHIFCDKTTKDYFDLWLNLELFSPLIIDCWADNMRLEFNMTTGMAQELEGVHVRVPGFGNTETVEWLDASRRSPSEYFAPIVESLVSWGYTRGINVVGAPYDWRRAPRELSKYFVKLKHLIETLFYKNGNQKIFIMAHSMGNCMANYFYHNFVNQAWKDKFLEGHISLAGAWGGSTQVIKVYASGYNMDHWRVVLPPSRLRTMQRSFTSSALLFPSPKLWGPNETFVITPRKNYSLSNIEDFFNDIEFPQGLEHWKSESPSLIIDPPGVKVYCIYGSEVKTPEQYIWYHNWLFPDYQPYISYGNGDGTVNLRSLSVCKQWSSDNNSGYQVNITVLDGADHMGILNDDRTIELIKNIIFK
ncbi:unnamed protein product [Meloidogyne enterolobii]|uniref:Uncharacterized protein n=1 Tax=Meloidogyne enterolobii TaxID=390850 RepID=A0ACB0XLU0_MELEN